MKRLPLATPAELRAWTVRAARANRRGLTAVVVLHCLAAVAGLVGPQVLGRLVDLVLAGDRAINLLAVIFAVLLFVQAALRRWARVRARMLGEQVLAQTREEYVGNALALPLGTVEAAGTGDLLSRTTTDIGRLDHAVRNAAPEIIVAVATVLLTVVVMAVTSPLLTLGLLAGLPLLIPVNVWFQRRVGAVMSWMLDRWGDVQSITHETVDGARAAEALGLTGRRIEEGRAALEEAADGDRRLRRLHVYWTPSLEVSHVLPVAAILLIGGWAYSGGLVGLGTITAMALYAQSLAVPLNEVLWWMEDLQVAWAALRRVLGVRAPAEPAEPTAPTAPAAPTARPVGSDLVLAGARFGYTAEREVLHGVDLRVPRGQRLAIVGPSGAGKSTLGRLIAGIATPSAGSVRVGGAEVHTLAQDVLRGEVLLLTQEQHVFAGTLRENLALPARSGDPRADTAWTDAELLAALDAVSAGEWARGLPEGLDTKVGAGAVPVTAAMAQQLALARVVLADPHTLVLDEATSLLDNSSARELERSLGAVLTGRTVIAIAHRLHTAAAADRVAVMENGRITEIGTHAELLAADGPYARLTRVAAG